MGKVALHTEALERGSLSGIVFNSLITIERLLKNRPLIMTWNSYDLLIDG